MLRTSIISILFLVPLSAWAKLNVVTTTSDLAALVSEIGGDKVDAVNIAKGTQDPHQIEAKPSYMVKMRGANLVLAQGLELESAWIVPLIQGSRNPKINVGSSGFLELGDKLDPIEIPKGQISRAQGDVHPGGNPHFQLDPIRLGQAAILVAERMSELDPGNRELFTQNALKFQKHMVEKSKEWKKRIEKTGVKEIITYHKTLGYFLDRFGMTAPLQLEPRPGIPPTAAHLIEVIEMMKARKIRLVLIEDFYDEKAGDKVMQDVPGAKVVMVPVSVGGEPEIKTSEQLIERVVKLIEDGSH